MYFLERGFQWSKTLATYEETTEELSKKQRQPGQPELMVPESVRESVSDFVSSNESLYAHTEEFIDVRTPNDEKRGVITIFLSCIFGIILYAAFDAGAVAFRKILAGYGNRGNALAGTDYFFLITLPLACFVFAALYIKCTFGFFRLESLTARRIIIRFNRLTRKVYLLRPKHLGGVRIMDWDKAEVVIDKNMSEVEGTGGFVILAWDKGDGVDLEGTATDNIEVTFVGKPTRNASELLAFWEYIRRYMENGPDTVPAPKKLVSKVPWPWLSFKAAWGLDTQFLRHSALWVFVVANLLMLPAILIHAAGHWISLLLCYEPRFPRDIEEAGR
ncbi:hypothetical protein N7373_19705 [Achromobacter mucicolens]|uniref:DUF6708 domain-containing protein n=1 Tax=Achromobacter mucicolens TaxID=1389922 RepID=UPI00244B3FCE|nr:DUF6708 domain-containing protein [Achromobacter mucicolens]MDH0093681.1 hypothetical protein [Achromobacter mucicolens]